MEGVRSRWPFALLEHAGHGGKRTIYGHSAALDRASCSVDSCDGRAFSYANSGQLAHTSISALRDAVQYESDDDDSSAPADLHPPTFNFGVSQTASGPSSPQQDLSLSDKSCQSNILKGSSMSRSFADWQANEEGTGIKTLARLGSDFSAVSCAFGSGSSSGTADSDSSLRGAGCADSVKLSAQYKGVVPQPNGRWGAQIYDKNQRIWLGTFSREEEAARAYDRAVWKYRGRDAVINFKSKKFGDAEEIFLSRLSREQVVDMLRRHTFEEELEQSKRQDVVRSCTQEKSNVEGDGGGRRPCSRGGPREQANAGADIDLHAHALQDNLASLVTQDVLAKARNMTPSTAELAVIPSNWVSMRTRENLFEKSLTPSDVGKLNRLVIPKQHAERCFPIGSGSNEKGMMLSLEDDAGKIWRFRYSYWASSQSYVFTKGWSGFVKEKKLEAGDIVRFDRSISNREELFISCRRRPSAFQAATTSAVADRLRIPSTHHPLLAHRDLSMHQHNAMALSSFLQGSAAEASFPAYRPRAWLDSASGCEFTNSRQDLRGEQGGFANDQHDRLRRLNLQRNRGCTVDFLSAEDHTRAEIGELGLPNVSVCRSSASSLHYSNDTDRFHDLQRRCVVSRIYIDGAPDLSAPCDLVTKAAGQRELALRHGSTMHATAPNLEGRNARTGLRLFGVDVKPGVSDCEETQAEKGWKRDSSAQKPGSFSSAEANSKRCKPSQGFQYPEFP